ncbi:hypothetical protein [Parafrankia discariae]|uniref:hypothetical protein n=1 Tax=Parafrankia discariae TaxID=365528 RepID=UPI0003815677|nr:hypothetical protein [Parafrankia discariae]
MNGAGGTHGAGGTAGGGGATRTDGVAEPWAAAEPWATAAPAAPAEPVVAEPAAAGSAPERSAEPLTTRAGLLAGLVCALAMVLVGPLLGLLWSVSAPRLDVQAVLSGAMSVFGVQSTVDAYFAMICAVAGLLGGLVAYLRAADAGWPVPIGLAVGGIGGSLLAGWVGHLRRSGQVLDALPANATPLLRDLVDFQVRATGLYLILPGAALLVLSVALWAGGTAPGWPRRRR